MRIAVIGASGWLGGSVAREALGRGHEVTAVVRDPAALDGLDGAARARADVLDPASVAAAVAGHDVVVCAVTDRSTGDRSLIPAAARSLLEALPDAGSPRLAWVGGGGSLEITPGEPLVEQPGFPGAYRAEALAQAEALALLRAAPAAIDWTYLSPPPHDLHPGEATRAYTVQGGDRAILHADGTPGGISSGDYAAALVDELERPQFIRERFTAAS